MRPLHTDRLHEDGDVVGEQFHRVDAVRLVGLARTARIDGDASEMLGIIGDLEGVAGIVGGEIGNEDKRLPCALLRVIHRNAIRFDFRHANLPLCMRDANVAPRSTNCRG